MKKIILSLVAASSLLMANNQVEINLNNDTLELSADIFLNNMYDVSDDANYYGILSYLGSEKSDSTHKDTKKLFTGGLKIVSPFSNDNGLTLGLGIKVVIASDTASKDFLAVPLSVYGQYDFNEKVNLNLEYSYAPKTLSFADAEGYNDMKLKLNYKVMDNGSVFVGARNIETSYKNISTAKYDNSLFVGYKVLF